LAGISVRVRAIGFTCKADTIWTWLKIGWAVECSEKFVDLKLSHRPFDFYWFLFR
jgi:hypothetical protein